MKRYRLVTAMLGIGLCLATAAFAQNKPAKAAPAGQTNMKALQEAMDPGEGQRKLAHLAGTFDVKVKTWATPSAPPAEFTGVNVNTWVLGDRFLQLMFSAVFKGELISAISYLGYNNVEKRYELVSMTTGGTDMEWYTGNFDAPGSQLTLKGMIANPGAGNPVPVEMRVKTQGTGDHAVAIWGEGPDGKMFEMMELTYTRTKP